MSLYSLPHRMTRQNVSTYKISSTHTRCYFLSVLAGNDYQTTNQQLDFSPRALEQCVNVPTIDNNVVESLEDFFATLTGSLPRLTVSPRMATVTIEDEEGEVLKISLHALSLATIL